MFSRYNASSLWSMFDKKAPLKQYNVQWTAKDPGQRKNPKLPVSSYFHLYGLWTRLGWVRIIE